MFRPMGLEYDFLRHSAQISYGFGWEFPIFRQGGFGFNGHRLNELV